MTFLGPEKFVRFEKHQKAFSGALRGAFRARKVFGSFEKRTPDPRRGNSEARKKGFVHLTSISKTNIVLKGAKALPEKRDSKKSTTHLFNKHPFSCVYKQTSLCPK